MVEIRGFEIATIQEGRTTRISLTYIMLVKHYNYLHNKSHLGEENFVQLKIIEKIFEEYDCEAEVDSDNPKCITKRNWGA